jgi:hypothetical protein
LQQHCTNVGSSFSPHHVRSDSGFLAFESPNTALEATSVGRCSLFASSFGFIKSLVRRASAFFVRRHGVESLYKFGRFGVYLARRNMKKHLSSVVFGCLGICVGFTFGYLHTVSQPAVARIRVESGASGIAMSSQHSISSYDAYFTPVNDFRQILIPDSKSK